MHPFIHSVIDSFIHIYFVIILSLPQGPKIKDIFHDFKVLKAQWKKKSIMKSKRYKIVDESSVFHPQEAMSSVVMYSM